ncbi:MAG: hypothetical protein Q8L37_00085, partial [Candidatus Gottesmanbacteria bacterium]|nr:hypothetical protein [Candidatus Gottesmanbacteria bacterium]
MMLIYRTKWADKVKFFMTPGHLLAICLFLAILFSLLFSFSVSRANAEGVVNFANDTFTATNGTLLQNHTSDSGATWTKSTGGGATNLTVDTNRIYS